MTGIEFREITMWAKAHFKEVFYRLRAKDLKLIKEMWEEYKK